MKEKKLPQHDGWYSFGNEAAAPAHFFRQDSAIAICGERLRGWWPWLIHPQPPDPTFRRLCETCYSRLQQLKQKGTA